jgi:outer membrane protein OmpA-like peptidoglycan-associated protein
MADYDGLSPGQVLADASVAEFIKSLGMGIADAQKALDENSVNQIAEFITPIDGLDGKTLLELGLMPAFYHYQHADLSCSLNITLKVEKDFSLKLNLNASTSNTTTENNNSADTSTETESGSSNSTQTRTANIAITSASAGVLNVGGTDFSLTGATPRERIENIQEALTTNNSTGIARVLFDHQKSALTITETPNTDEVAVTPNSVAFTAVDSDYSIIRIGQTDTSEYKFSAAKKTGETTAQADVEAQANHVKAAVDALSFNTELFGPEVPVNEPTFDTGKANLRSGDLESLKRLAIIAKDMNTTLTVTGFADRQLFANNSEAQNITLSENRAKVVADYLKCHGVPESQIVLGNSEGDAAAERAGNTPGQDNQNFRKASVTRPNDGTFWLRVTESGSSGSIVEGQISPDKRGDSGTTNGFIFLRKKRSINFDADDSVTIESIDFDYKGNSDGNAGTPEEFAANLARDVNAHPSANLKASVQGSVVTVSKDGDPFNMTLVTTGSRNITLTGNSGVTITSEFSRTTTSNQTQASTGNRTVAVGGSVDIGFSRKFEMDVTGNSSISARLVSIPAPPEFLSTIKEYLKED